MTDTSMPRTTTAAALAKLLDQCTRPVYVIDAARRIVHCNKALAAWMELDSERIVGRVVEYHSEVAGKSSSKSLVEPPLTELCPPPKAFVGETSSGTISCMASAGRLVHRRAEFVPLELAVPKPGGDGHARAANAVLVLLANADLTPQELTLQLSELPGDVPADELHRTLRQFRRAQAASYGIESLLGSSAAMRKVRAQVAAAVTSSAHVLVSGPMGSGRGHVARAIHYQAGGDSPSKLVPFDCRTLNDEPLRRALEVSRGSTGPLRLRPTLLLENLESLAVPFQERLLSMLQESVVPFRVIATLEVGPPSRGGQCGETGARSTESRDAIGPPAPEDASKQRLVPLGSRHLLADTTPTVNATLLDSLSTIFIYIPALAERVADLPLLAQYFLESCNRGSDKQVGSIRPEALDLLALHCWPRELDELREVISAAHQTCKSHEITPGDLPRVIHHAAQAAARPPRRPPDRIVLDELLASIEKEIVTRALAQVDGNKSAAAELLGMTRPRLYRRMVQLGLISEPTHKDQIGPEFIEQDPADSPS
jgi:transcriptional regulator with AAA-type ATPase domain